MYQNKKIGVIIAAAGSGTRMGGGISKQFRKIEDIPVLTRAVSAFDIHPFIDEILVVTREDSLDFCRKEMIAPFGFVKVHSVVPGGETRQDSVYRGLLCLSPDVEYVLIHDGARPFISQKVISDTVAAVIRRGAAVVAVPVKDTIKTVSFSEEKDAAAFRDESRKNDRQNDVEGHGSRDGIFTCTPDRSTLYAVQTPQAFFVPLLREAMEKAFSEKFYGTDDSVLVERLDKKVYLVKGEYENLKITTAEDMEIGRAVLRYTASRDGEKIKTKDEQPFDFVGGTPHKGAAEGTTVQNTLPMVRMGTGFDVHRLAVDRKLILGGVEIPWEKGLLGHSDADVLVHAVIDALLGAAALGDIGKHFPDKDEAYRGASSLALLEQVEELLGREGYGVGNVDAVVIAEQPKIAPFIPDMREKIARVLKISGDRVSIKATTTEGLGYCGRGEGIASQAVAVIYSLEEK